VNFSAWLSLKTGEGHLNLVFSSKICSKGSVASFTALRGLGFSGYGFLATFAAVMNGPYISLMLDWYEISET